MDTAAEVDRHAVAGARGLARAEERLVAEAQQGSDEAIDALVRAYWDQAYRAAVLIVGDGHLAEDIVQEAFVSALGSLPRFRRELRFAPWLRAIVANRSVDALRARARQQRTLDAAAFQRCDEGADTPEPVSDPELVHAICKLPEDQRMVVVLRYVLDLPPSEIAEVLGLSRGTVGSRMRRGLDAVRESLEQENADD